MIHAPQKLLGQHFLRCGWVTDTMVRAAKLRPDDTVLEVGAGEGALTCALAPFVRKVIAVEKDAALVQFLNERLAREKIKNVTVIEGDILKLLPSIPAIHKLQTTSYKLVSNIPYYLTSRLLRILLASRPLPKNITLLIQKEVAERITARPPRMNMLALSVQAYGTPIIIKPVPKTCFQPTPKIDSAIIHISDMTDALFIKNDMDEKIFFAILKSGFSQKRKMLSNTLKDTIDRPLLQKAFAACGIPENARAENLSLEQWVALVKFL